MSWRGRCQAEDSTLRHKRIATQTHTAHTLHPPYKKPKAFKDLDKDGSGAISADELGAALQRFGIADDAESLLASADSDNVRGRIFFHGDGWGVARAAAAGLAHAALGCCGIWRLCSAPSRPIIQTDQPNRPNEPNQTNRPNRTARSTMPNSPSCCAAASRSWRRRAATRQRASSRASCCRGTDDRSGAARGCRLNCSCRLNCTAPARAIQTDCCMYVVA